MIYMKILDKFGTSIDDIFVCFVFCLFPKTNLLDSLFNLQNIYIYI